MQVKSRLMQNAKGPLLRCISINSLLYLSPIQAILSLMYQGIYYILLNGTQSIKTPDVRFVYYLFRLRNGLCAGRNDRDDIQNNVNCVYAHIISISHVYMMYACLHRIFDTQNGCRKENKLITVSHHIHPSASASSFYFFSLFYQIPLLLFLFLLCLSISFTFLTYDHIR